VKEKDSANPTPCASPVLLSPTDGPGERLAAQMSAAWARGDCLPAEHFLNHQPELHDLPEAGVRLVYEEVCLRQERGDEVEIEELQRRFPNWASELSVMLDCHRLVQARLAPPRFPAVGEALGDFRLIAEIGRSSHARVFLAAQPTLADRVVVLKVTPRQDREFLSLARLQHTHIIPLHGVHDFPERNLRGLCQPYLGGATLERLLDALRGVPASKRSGRALVDALDGDRADGARSGGPGPRSTLARAPYPEAICWIGACLAEALHHAHERGLVHLDLKPSNVLLAADGQPLLLDFHLALHPVSAGQPAPEGVGGTLEFMSPEQRAAFDAARRGQPMPAAVDCRSDVYSLGRVLYSALGGEEKGDGRDLHNLRRYNSQVSVGLADIVHRCLARDPADRYPTAAALAHDLRRHLAGLPLRGVSNRSVGERWHKWRRRRPNALLWTAALLALSLGTVAIGAVSLERLSDAREALREGQEQMSRHSYAEAVRTLARGKERVEGWPGSRRLAEQLDAILTRARRASAAGQLHAVTDRLRMLAGADVLSERDMRALEGHCKKAWEARHLVAGRSAAALEETAEEQLRADLIDLALLWTDLKRRLAPGDGARRSEARAVLAELQALCDPSAAVARERRSLGEKVGPEADAPGRTAWESASLGRSLLRAGELDRAAEELARAVDLRPGDFWAHFYRGVCAYRRGRHSDAASSFSVAVALAPEFAEVYHNRALAHAAAGDLVAALRDYDRALALSPALASAELNRGVLHYQQRRYREALADLEQALRHGADPIATQCNLALVHLARGERAAARESVARALQIAPAHPQARQIRDRLQHEK
jgi:serine/threonine protein kinase/tetratricopeptide (TPR) repeat protein